MLPIWVPGTHGNFSWRGGDINQQVEWGAVIVAPPGAHSPLYREHYHWHSGPTVFYADTLKAARGSPPASLPTGSPFNYQQRGWYRSLYYRTQQGQLPRITTQPVGQMSTENSVTLSVTASGQAPLTYQWFKNNSLLIGKESSSLIINASTAPPTPYVVRVTDANGNHIFSDLANLSFYSSEPPSPTAPSIASLSPSQLLPLASPQTQTLRIYGSSFTPSSSLVFTHGFSVFNSVPARLTYVSANQLNYEIIVAGATGNWTVKVVNGAQESGLASFTVNTPPPNTGSLTVNLSPAGAVSAGAQWRVDGGAYRNSGDTATGLTPGSHTVSFKPVSGYTTPAERFVSVANGATATDSGTYAVITPSTYTLTLNTSNPDAGGATASPLASGNIYAAGAMVQLTAYANYGYHFVGWSGALSGTTTPTTIVMDGNKSVTANFASGDPRLGTLIVTIQPPEAAAAGVKWGQNQNDHRDSGTSLALFPSFPQLVLHLTNGWWGQTVFSVMITAGQTTNYVVTVSSTGGSTVGSDPRFYATLAGLAGNAGTSNGTNGEARFNQPASVAVDSGGNVYVADYFNHTIRKISPAGAVSTLAGLAGIEGYADGAGSAARFSYPNGVAVDNASNVYVADLYNHAIRKITPGGVVSTLAGLAGSHGNANGLGSVARFYFPSGVAVDIAGNVYVTDFYNHTIRKITSDGAVSTFAGLAGSHGNADGIGSVARFYFPNAVAVDNANNVYVADTENQTIRKITSDGTVSTLAGFPESGGTADGTGNAARFLYPTGVAADNGGNVYVADNNNDTIRKVTLAGVVSTLAGLSGNIGSVDGNGNTVRFNRPSGLALDGAGNIFIADAQNHTIRTTRQVGKANQIITFALLPDKLASDQPFALTASASSGLAVAFSIVSGPATVSNNVVTLTGGGTVTVRASQLGNTNFNAAPDVDRSFTVTKLPQFITFGALSRQVFGDAPFALSATASSGLPVEFTALSGPAIVSGNVVTLNGAGLVVLRASQSGNATYSSAPNVDQVVIVAPGNNVIAALQRLANGMSTFRFYGEAGTNYVVQASTNLVDWLPLATNQVSGLGYLEFTDVGAINRAQCFYRLISQ